MKSDKGSGPTEILPDTGHVEGEAASEVCQEDPGMTSDVRVGCRYRTPLFQSESIVDDAGHLIRLHFVDMRTPEARLPITTVIKGCSQKYAIETYPTVRISKPTLFRRFGERLIKDSHEARVSKTLEHTRINHPEDLHQARSDSAEKNKAAELVGATARFETTGTKRTSRSRHAVSYGKNGWILCTAIEPTTHEEMRLLKTTLPDHYDHFSFIHRPREFARSLGLMVAEHLGPQGQTATLTDRIGDQEGIQAEYPSQTVFHGPVIYVPDPYDFLDNLHSDLERVICPVFVKRIKHRDQREYRFAIWTEKEPRDELVDLPISLAMRGSMRKIDVRDSPEATVSRRAGQPSAATPVSTSDPDETTEQPKQPQGPTRIQEESEAREDEYRPVIGGTSPFEDSPLVSGWENIRRSYPSIEGLRAGLYEYPDERRVEVASATFFVEPYVRFLLSTYRDPIEKISVTGDNFVTVYLRLPPGTGAVGRIAIGPHGKGMCRIETDGFKWGCFVDDTRRPPTRLGPSLDKAGLLLIEPSS